MKNIKKYIIGLFFSLTLISFGMNKEEIKENKLKENKLNLKQEIVVKGKPGADKVILSFAATSDVHGRIYPYEYGIDKESKNSGFAKTYTVVKELRKENPNLILLDVGDTVQDNSAELFNERKVHPMVEAMNAMNYDAWILGNHEFNFEKSFLLKNIEAFNGAVISCNIENSDDASKFVLPYQIYIIDGVRVALVGGTPPHIPIWEASSPEHYEGLTFEDPMTAVGKVLKEIDGQYDVLIGAFHLARRDEYGVTGAFDLAEAYPQFTLIFAGHEHAKYATKINQTMVMEPGSYGSTVANGNIKVVKKNNRWIVEDVQVENIDVTNIEADKDILEQFKDVHKESIADANIVVGRVNKKFIERVDYITGADKVTTMPTSQIEDNAIINLINEVQSYYANSDISAAGIFNVNSNLNVGDFKKKDVAFIYQYTNTLMGVNMTGENILKYMEWSANYYNQTKPGDLTISFDPNVRGYNYDMFSGVSYKIDISKPAGERIVDVKIDGKPIVLDKTYKVAINNYRFGTLLSLGLVTEKDKYYDSYEQLQDNGRIRDLIIKYVQENLKGELNPKVDNNWEIIGFDKNVAGREEIIEKIKSGEILIPKSEDGRTLNIKSINIEEIKR